MCMVLSLVWSCDAMTPCTGDDVRAAVWGVLRAVLTHESAVADDKHAAGITKSIFAALKVRAGWFAAVCVGCQGALSEGNPYRVVAAQANGISVPVGPRPSAPVPTRASHVVSAAIAGPRSVTGAFDDSPVDVPVKVAGGAPPTPQRGPATPQRAPLTPAVQLQQQQQATPRPATAGRSSIAPSTASRQPVIPPRRMHVPEKAPAMVAPCDPASFDLELSEGEDKRTHKQALPVTAIQQRPKQPLPAHSLPSNSAFAQVDAAPNTAPLGKCGRPPASKPDAVRAKPQQTAPPPTASRMADVTPGQPSRAVAAMALQKRGEWDSEDDHRAVQGQPGRSTAPKRGKRTADASPLHGDAPSESERTEDEIGDDARVQHHKKLPKPTAPSPDVTPYVKRKAGDRKSKKKAALRGTSDVDEDSEEEEEKPQARGTDVVQRRAWCLGTMCAVVCVGWNSTSTLQNARAQSVLVRQRAHHPSHQLLTESAPTPWRTTMTRFARCHLRRTSLTSPLTAAATILLAGTLGLVTATRRTQRQRQRHQRRRAGNPR